MKKIDVNFKKPSQQQLISLLELYQTGKYPDAEKLSLSITQEFPNHPFAWKVLGAILKQAGRINESLIACQKSVQLNAQDVEAHNNLGNILKELERSKEAEASYRKAIVLKPDYTEAHSNLGIMLQQQGRLDEAETSYRQAIALKPDFAVGHNNIGVIFNNTKKKDEAISSFKKAIELEPTYLDAYKNLGSVLYNCNRLNEAQFCYKKVISLKPDYIEMYIFLSNILFELKRLDEAELMIKKVIALKSDFHESYNILGNILDEKGDSFAAIDSYKKAIKIKPNFIDAWHNIYHPLQVIKSQTSKIEKHLPDLDEKVSSKYSQIAKSILNYRLYRQGLTSNSFLNKALEMLSIDENILVKNPRLIKGELIKKPTLPKKITSLVYFGRSGTGLLHSLIDGHPEVSTLPSIFFSEYFDHITWEKIIEGGWYEMADRFTLIYPILFDASLNLKIPTRNLKLIDNFGKKEGMINLGKERNEVLSVNKKIFIKELKKLMYCYEHLDAFIFFKLVHSAYEKALRNLNKKNHIFYHIHNPGMYAQLNFLKLAPHTNWLMMVREPIQNCEASVIKNFLKNDYKKISGIIFQMLFEVDQPIFQKNNSIGVRLEDLKEHPKKTIQALCSWMGIKENDSLYQMTAQGKRWWGDPTSNDYKKDGMDPFGKSSINRNLGSVFSEKDQFVLSTLFYPFNVRFNYVKENLQQFKKDLQIIRPMIDKMFDFEKIIAEQTKMSAEKFMKSGDYLYLRSGIIERWDTLNEFYTYPNMLTPLKIY